MLESNNAQILKHILLLKSNTSEIRKTISNTCKMGQHTFSLKSNINHVASLSQPMNDVIASLIKTIIYGTFTK